MSESVKITKRDFLEYDDVVCDWYTCPKCQDSYIFNYGFEFGKANYCPSCGVKLEWDLS